MEEKEMHTAAEPLEEQSLPPKITKDNIDPNKGSKKGVAFLWIRAFVYTILSSLLIAFAAYSLIAPNHFTIGGASGLAILINVATNGKVPQSLVILSINLPLVVISFFFVKKKFAVLSAANIGLQSLWLLLFEEVFPTLTIEFGDGGAKIFAAIAAGLCIGTSIALAFKVGGSTGGADIAAVMIQRKINATSIAWVIFAINSVIIGASVILFREYKLDADGNKILDLGATLLPIMMAVFEAYIEGKTNESLTNGFHSAIEFRIITDKPEAMSAALMKELSRGVTAIPAKGMYTKENHTMLLCVVSRRQVVTLKRIMKQIDPDSFATMSKVSQVWGLGFYTDEI